MKNLGKSAMQLTAFICKYSKGWMISNNFVNFQYFVCSILHAMIIILQMP